MTINVKRNARLVVAPARYNVSHSQQALRVFMWPFTRLALSAEPIDTVHRHKPGICFSKKVVHIFT